MSGSRCSASFLVGMVTRRAPSCVRSSCSSRRCKACSFLPERTVRSSPRLLTVAWLGPDRETSPTTCPRLGCERFQRACSGQEHMVPEGARRWGWKEPNSHLFLAQLQTHFGDRLRYVHVIRNGVYMAYSANQSQVRRWGRQFDIEADIDPPVASLDYWIRSNELAIDRGRAMKPGSFLLVNHDQLCESPREQVTRLVDFLGIRASQEELEELIALPQPPKPVGISHQRMITEFGEERLARVRALGFALGDEASPLGS